MERTERIIDIHAHILPGVDDGATDWQEARWMLACAYKHGIRTLIATPHYSHRQNLAKIYQAAEQMQEEAAKISLDLQIYLGQEILYFDGIVDCLQNGQALAMAGSRYVLIEFMPEVTFKKMYQGVRKLLLAGYYPIIAHVERYGALRDEGQMLELAKAGCLMQMNYKSIQGSAWNRSTRWCRTQVKAQRIHFLATDMHNKNYRTPEIGKSLEWLSNNLAASQFACITEKNARNMINSGHQD